MIVRQSPQGCALDRAMDPESAAWGLSEQLLASVFDALQIANWQRGAGKRQDFPKQLQRPGVGPEGKKFGSKPIPMDEMQAFLGWDSTMKEGAVNG